MKKLILVGLLSLSSTSFVFADSTYHMGSNNIEINKNDDCDRHMQAYKKYHKRQMYNENQNREIRQEQRYNILITVEKDGNIIKDYKIRANSLQEFIIINSQEAKYNHPEEMHYSYNDEDSEKITTGYFIKGSIKPSNNSNLQNVHVNILHNEFLGFEESCHGKKCVDVPQEILTKHEVDLQTSFNNTVTITEFKNQKNQNIQVKMLVSPVMDNNKY